MLPPLRTSLFVTFNTLSYPSLVCLSAALSTPPPPLPKYLYICMGFTILLLYAHDHFQVEKKKPQNDFLFFLYSYYFLHYAECASGWVEMSLKIFIHTVNTQMPPTPPLAFLVAVLFSGCLFMDCANDRKAGGAVTHEMKQDYKRPFREISSLWQPVFMSLHANKDHMKGNTQTAKPGTMIRAW